MRRRWLGGLVMSGGCIVVTLALGVDLGTLALFGPPYWPAIVAPFAVAVIVLPVTFSGVTKPAMREHMPEIRERFDRSLTQRSFVAWAVYLFGYELLFRGFLLSTLLNQMRPWPALAVMTALYTWAHMHKAWPETFGAVIMGFVFGGMALWSGGFFAPFLLHLAIAFGSEMTAARRIAT